MSMEAYLFLAVIFGGFALGDTVGTLTKGKVSAVFTSLILFLIGYMTGLLPEDILTRAGIAEIANMSVLLLIFHMGTLVNIHDFLREWRTVVVTVIAMLSALAGVILMSLLGFLDLDCALVGIPILNGGSICANIMIEGAMDQGLALAASFGAVIFSCEKLFGSLPTSVFSQRSARTIVAEFRQNKLAEKAAPVADLQIARPPLWKRLEKFYTLDMCLLITAVGGLLSLFLAEVTSVNPVIFALILGLLFRHFGIAPPKILDKCNSSGILISILYATIIPSLAAVKLTDIAHLGWMMLVFFIGAFAGILLFLYVLPFWKLVGSRDLAIGIAMAQFLGFPHTMIMAKEAARMVGQTPEEQAAIEDRLVPAYVIAGMASVTTLSIVIAGVLVRFL